MLKWMAQNDRLFVEKNTYLQLIQIFKFNLKKVEGLMIKLYMDKWINTQFMLDY